MTNQLKQLSEAATEDRFLIMKRDLYYMPEGKGYTGVKKQAGRFSLSDTAVRFPDCDDSGLSFIHEDEAPEFSKACFEDVKLAVLRQERDEADDRAVALEAQLTEAHAREAVAYEVAADICHTEITAREAQADDAYSSMERARRDGMKHEAAFLEAEIRALTQDRTTTALEQIKADADKAGFERGVRASANAIGDYQAFTKYAKEPLTVEMQKEILGLLNKSETSQ